MAGHSKWANIKHKKSAQDAKRGKVFTKLAKEIMISAKLGGSDESSNPRLRTAVLKARQSNMPKDNIDRAVKKGAGELEGITYEEILYEGYGPGGVAFLVDVMTDKKSRTLPEIKNIFSKIGGNLAEAGSVSYLFDYVGLILVKAENATEDEVLEATLESGGEDFEADEDSIYAIKTKKEEFHAVLSAFEKIAQVKQWEIIESTLTYLPQNHIDAERIAGETNMKLIDILENHDDIQNVYCNLNITEELLQE